MTALDHWFVVDYLARLRAEAQRLPREQADELVADIENHLLDAFEQPPLSGDPTEAQILEVLERLGTPAELVDAAGAPPMPPPMNVAPTKTNRGRAEAGAAVLLVLAALVFVLWFISIPMWVVGLVLLLVSSRWTPGQRVLGALSWGTLLPMVWVMGATTATVTTCEGEGCTPPEVGLTTLNYVAIGFTVVYLAFVVWASVRLIRAARQP
ncbi:HAAS signaling domain-containing protein [Propionibacteriaceae bacterium Y1923]|uniref:HAAS signaling domain-containing protein n=1 Tax=Aestuariimicrobium sp. Y1814 TaxID=3418742 RepID=UPI003C2702C3